MEKRTGKPTIYNKLQDRLTRRVSPLFEADPAADIMLQLTAGKNKYLKLERIENSSYDPRWLNEIEECIPDLDAIIKNPKKVIENVSEVVPIELARKTNADSVKHLATHSQFVKEIDEDGEVVPNKILNIRSDDFYQTYENRFIATLIRKLILFVEKRYTLIQENINVRKTEILMYKNKSMVDGKEVEIETKIRVASDIELDEDEKKFNRSFLKRIEEVRKYLLYFHNSEFMKMLKTERNVRNPIILTNIIRKNHQYNHAYQLYKFIEHYDLLGVEFKVEDKYEHLNNQQVGEINNALMTNFLVLRGHETVEREKVKIKKHRPKIETSIDEEEYVYGDYIGSPLNLVRVDQGHLDYLESLINKNIPLHPTKEEKEYWKEEIEQARAIRAEKKEIEKIIREKKKAAARAEKYFNAVIEQRLREEEEKEILRNQQIEQDKLSEIEKARRELTRIDENKEIPTPVDVPTEGDENIETPVFEQVQNEGPAPVEEIVPEIIKKKETKKKTAKKAGTKKTGKKTTKGKVDKVPVDVKVEDTTPKVEEVVVKEVEEEIVLTDNPNAEEVNIVELPADLPVLEKVYEELPNDKPKKKKKRKKSAKKVTRIKEVSEPIDDKESQEEIPEPTPVEEAPVIPVVEEAPAEETPAEEAQAEEQPQEEAPVETKPKPKKKRKKRKKSAKKVEEAPAEEQPQEEISEEQPQEEVPAEEVAEEEEPSEEMPEDLKEPLENETDAEFIARRKKWTKHPDTRTPIPGKFIVKTHKGYYVNKFRVSINKDDARIFEDFNLANDIKKLKGGKVVKL